MGPAEAPDKQLQTSFTLTKTLIHSFTHLLNHLFTHFGHDDERRFCPVASKKQHTRDILAMSKLFNYLDNSAHLYVTHSVNHSLWS